MSTPSDPVLSWLRELVKQRGLNTAELARRADLPRARLRRVLGGGERMLVDELIAVSNALELSPTDMGLPQLEGQEDMPIPEVASDPTAPDPYGNHAEQLFRMGFALGCDFRFSADTSELGDAGVPTAVLAALNDPLIVIKLDAAYHQYNEPRYDPAGITLTLSFNTGLADCTFPWKSLRAVTFQPELDDASVEDPPEDEPDSTPEGRPHLRLVT